MMRSYLGKHIPGSTWWINEIAQMFWGHLGTQKILNDGDGGMARWEFIEQLLELQNEQGLRLANKLWAAQIQWKKQKMKVNLPAQTNKCKRGTWHRILWLSFEASCLSWLLTGIKVHRNVWPPF